VSNVNDPDVGDSGATVFPVNHPDVSDSSVKVFPVNDPGVGGSGAQFPQLMTVTLLGLVPQLPAVVNGVVVLSELILMVVITC